MDEEVTAVIPTGMPEEGRLEGVVRDRGDIFWQTWVQASEGTFTTLCYYARPHTSEFFEKTSESNLDDSGQPVWDLGFV